MILKGVMDSDIVYSTAHGRMCPSCGQPIKKCVCREIKKSRIAGDGTVRVRLEKKGRKGKGVTVISGLPYTSDELEDLAKELKRKCCCGGTVKKGVIEIQGDFRDVIITELKNKGIKAKRIN